MYTTPADVRDLLGLTISEVEDHVLEELITKSQNIVLHYIQIQVRDEVIALDAETGTTIPLDNKYIADTNFDKTINASDVLVYGWIDSEDPGSRSSLALSILYPEHGIIVLSSDASDYEKVTVNYSYYTCSIDWNLLDMAVAYYAAMLWVAKEEFLVPDDLTIGNVRVRQRQPWDRFRDEFLRMINHITEVPMDVVNYRKIMINPRGEERYSGPGSILETEI